MIQEKYGDYKLSTYEPVTLVLPDFTVSDEDTIAEMERIAARHSTNITIDPRPVCASDMVAIDILTKEDSGTFPGLTRDNVDVQLGMGVLPEEIEVALLGHEPGDVVEAHFTYTDYTQVASEKETPADGGCGAGEAGEPEVLELTSTVKILAIRKFVIPEVTDEWVASNIALCNTVEEFKEKTRAKLLKERRKEYLKNVEQAVMEEIGKRLIDEPPAEVVTRVEKQMFREFDRFLEQYEMDRPTYMAIQGLDDFTFADQINKDARERVCQDIALAAWATHYGVTLEDVDIDFMFGEPTPERTYEARVEAEQSGQIETFKDLALRAKVTEILTQDAIYMTSDGTVDEDFKKSVEEKYMKLEMVRNHATSAPMVQPPMVHIPEGN